MNPHQEETQRFDELFRRIQFTCKARYNASRRLRTYHLFSQITPACISVGLVIIPLSGLLGFNAGFEQRYVDLMQIVFAVMLLAYSLLLGIGNFSARAVKVHQCGMELGRLARKIFPYKRIKDSTALDAEYDSMCSDYYNCLEKHENHTTVDFLAAKYELLSSGGKFDFFVEVQKATVWLNKFSRELFSLSHFIISAAAIISWIAFMFSSAG